MTVAQTKPIDTAWLRSPGTDILYDMQGSPSGCGWLQIPGVSHVEIWEHHQASQFTPSSALLYTYRLRDEVR